MTKGFRACIIGVNAFCKIQKKPAPFSLAKNEAGTNPASFRCFDSKRINGV
jgi:hypothetical protein